MNYPPCPFLSNGVCNWLSERIRPEYKITPFLCNGFCQKQGPYCGRALAPVDEKLFVDRLAKLKKPAKPALPQALATHTVVKPTNPFVVKWAKVRNLWNDAERFVAAAKSRGLVATSAQALGLNETGGKRVAAPIYEQRKASCLACAMLKTVNNLQSCGACGCGQNKLAVISDAENPGRYTKLEFPQLECPMEKPGFSNYKKLELVSVVITALNESPEWINQTIQSLRATAYDLEIILVDDHSDIPVVVQDPAVKVIRNLQRLGCAPSRHLGALQATHEYLLFTDAHMIFDKYWLDEFRIQSGQAEEKVAFCGICLILDEGHPTLESNLGAHFGARLSLYEAAENQVLEGKWVDPQPADAYPISCLMGAVYFIKRKYFFRLRGFSDLKMWGSDEPCLSWKILRSGGEIRLLKKVRVGHFFREVAPYVTWNPYMLYNKIRMALTLFPEEVGHALIAKLPQDGNFEAAMQLIAADKPLIEAYRKYYQSIFSETLPAVCKKYSIALPA